MIKIGTTPHIMLDVKGYSHPEANDHLDGNWLITEITISAGAWRGKYKADLRAEEFTELKKELEILYKKLEHSFKFETMEEWISIIFTGNKKGQITIEGKAYDDPGIGDMLKFSFEIDQSYLPKIIEEVKEITIKFPEKGTHNH